MILQRLLRLPAVCLLVGLSDALRLPIPPVARKTPVCRKVFFTNAATAAVVGTAAIATGARAAVAVASTSNKGPYEPPPGSMAGKVVVITGGTAGLGLESAKRLALAGATIVLTSRTEAKGQAAIQSVSSYLSENGMAETPKLYSLVLDLDDLSSVKAFPAAFSKLGLKNIDVLMNNAGVMAVPDLQLTKDGYERTFQSNHLGHFVLTAGLYPFLSREKATVINVSSEAYNFASKASDNNKQGLDLENLNGNVKYGPWSSYGLSKLANIQFTQELQRRAADAGQGWLSVVTLHPGAVQTDLGRNLVGEQKWNDLKNGNKGSLSPLESAALKAASAFTKTVEDGASTQVFLASGADGMLQKGQFYENCKQKILPGWATDAVSAKALWDASESLGGVRFDLKSD